MAASLCIDTKHGSEHAKFGLDQCLKDQQGRSGEQVKLDPNLLIKYSIFQEFELTWRQDIRPKGRELCFDVPNRGKRTPIILFTCHGIID
jgi:polypeptide N-acetylgalactosaminyltransferase